MSADGPALIYVQYLCTPWSPAMSAVTSSSFLFGRWTFPPQQHNRQRRVALYFFGATAGSAGMPRPPGLLALLWTPVGLGHLDLHCQSVPLAILQETPASWHILKVVLDGIWALQDNIPKASFPPEVVIHMQARGVIKNLRMITPGRIGCIPRYDDVPQRF